MRAFLKNILEEIDIEGLSRKKIKRNLNGEGIMGILSKFFGKKNPMDVSLDVLRETQATLEIQIRKIENEIASIDREIAALFERAKSARSKSEELTIATKIKTLNQRKKNLQATHMQLNKQLMLISNLAIIKENEAILKGTPTWEMLRNMSPEELERNLTTMQLDAQNFNENLNQMLGITDQTLGVGADFEEDEELAEIMKTIHAVKEGELEPETESIVKLRSILLDIQNNYELVRFNLIEFLRKELGFSKETIEELLYILEDILNDWARIRGAKKINSQTLNLLTIEFLIRLILPYLKTKHIPPGNEIKNQLEQLQQVAYCVKIPSKHEYCEYLSLYEQISLLMSPTTRECVENILKTAKHVIDNSTKIAKMDFYLRVNLWNELQEKYMLYEKGVCGQFPKHLDLVKYLDNYIRIHLETALAFLALTFKENKEEYPPAIDRFSESELHTIKLIREYDIFGKLESEEIMRRILANDEHVKTLLKLYPTMEEHIISSCSNWYLYWYLMCSWEKQKERIDKKVNEILDQLLEHNLTTNGSMLKSNPNQEVLAIPFRNFFETVSIYLIGTKKLSKRISKKLSNMARILAMSSEFTRSIGWGFLKHLDKKPSSITQEGELYIENEIIHEELEELLDTGKSDVLSSF
ncbi:SNF7 family protein [Thermococcus gorgonarius]|uniref:SNF7 family protein n=1 Tax=Thermococcus gorgonarius TaxID=71997 RepID=UPI001E649DA4|nr:SNF7 family protein [Thermococcus gorgonarius]